MMEIPLVEHGSLMLRAAQVGAVLPNMALVIRFAEPVEPATMEAEVARLSAHPFRLGRRLRGPHLPGARPRWQVAPDPPPLEVADPPAGDAELARWLDDQVSVRHDPQGGAGWQMTASPTPDGGTLVTFGLIHLFGTGRDIVGSCYGDMPEVDLSTLPAGRPWPLDEALDVGDRLWRGARGAARLAGEVAKAPWGVDRDGDLATLKAPLAAWRGKDPSRGRASQRRVAAIATLPAEKWDARAAEGGGTSTSLQVALVANLLRAARAARGGPVDREVRIIAPVDLADRNELPDASASVGPIRLTSATVVVPGGRPEHGSLTEVRAETRRAFGEAAAQVERTGRVPVAPGVIDAMKLLPDNVTRRVVFGVHGHYDAAASNVGHLPPAILRLGSHQATDAALLAFPLGSDLSVALGRHGDVVQIGVIADPSRLGSGPPLRDRLAAELDDWGLPDGVW